jgi:steroid delta-isomerase-like uncharacterized protein
MPTDPMQPEQVVHDYVAWVNGDPSKIDALAESVDVYNPGLSDGEVHGRAAYDSYIQGLRTGLPDFHFTENLIVSGGDVVIVEFTITGTHDGELKGIPPTNRKLELRGMEKFHVVDGQIQEMHAYFDTQEIPEQLGLTFPAIIGQLPKLVLRKVL